MNLTTFQVILMNKYERTWSEFEDLQGRGEVSPLLLKLFLVGLRIAFDQVLQLGQVVGKLVVLSSWHFSSQNVNLKKSKSFDLFQFYYFSSQNEIFLNEHTFCLFDNNLFWSVFEVVGSESGWWHRHLWTFEKISLIWFSDNLL